MREAMLYEKLTGSRVQCHVCQWRCVVQPGQFGVCRVRHNQDGVLRILNYAQISSAAVDPIEKKPLFHFYPTSFVFSLGGWGCNFHCEHCQNWEISMASLAGGIPGSRQISPQEAIEAAKRYSCSGIAWTYNEPAIWHEYTLDSAKLARQENLYTVYVTNGYITEEALDSIGPYLDAYRVDVKGFTDSFYRNLCKVSKWQGILDIAARAQEKWDMHVEVVTNIIPTMNDDDAQLEALATWIRDNLGEMTPWHVTRFHPYYHLQHLYSTPVETLERAYNIGKKVGLRFIYVGNVPGHKSENTICYNCGNTAIKRWGYHTQLVGLDGSNCKFCGANLNITRTPRTLGQRS